MILSLSIFEFLTIGQNIVFMTSLIIGGIWAIYKYNRRHESASIKLNIENFRTYNSENGIKNILLDLVIENNGKREVKLYFNYKPRKLAKKYENPEKHYNSRIYLYKVKSNDEHELIDQKMGLLSSQKTHFTGRFRPGVVIRLPYLFKEINPGLYFVEFFIDINMLSYYKKNDKNDKPIKEWTDRQFYYVE